MKTINQSADNISRNLVMLGAPRDLALDPMTVLMIISIIVDIVRALQVCFIKPASVASKASSPGIISRMIMRSIIKRNIAKIDSSRKDIRSLMFDIEKSIYTEAKELDLEDFEAIYLEAK